ncbi:MAG: NifB/NifX family molybdenum-iron cluster-binding protein [Methanomassiliicoccus sp.]|nr:NifB/NifX family molybdenum-iron cluster-binding protein [Methanomassiliicoccus sp.]
MKLCVTTEEPDIHSLVSEDFGHSPFFLMYDTDTGSWEAFPNLAGESTVGIGIAAAEQVVAMSPDVVLTGHIGMHGTKKLQSRNIRIVQDEEGTAEASIKRWIKKYGDTCRPAPTPARTAPPE